ncbi:MAG: hypothetical protein K6T17_03870 [Fimbriimonadales bacterium]|nr:hypothetical protein [Fimbriimonadales bacterium]
MPRKGLLELPERPLGKKFFGENARCVGIPLGGIGTGHFCLFGDGSFRQWQIFNVIHHLAFLPGTFFALSVRRPRREPKASLLLSRRFLLKPPERMAPSVSDHYVPEELKKMAPYALLSLEEPVSGEGSPLHNLRGEMRFTTAYPVAWLDFLLPEERMTCSLTAWTPFLIFDSDLSGMPLAVFDWQFRNEGEEPLTMCFLRPGRMRSAGMGFRASATF